MRLNVAPEVKLDYEGTPVPKDKSKVSAACGALLIASLTDWKGMQFDLGNFPRKNWNLGNRDRVRIRQRVFDVLKIPMGKIRTSTWNEACSFFDDACSYVVIFLADEVEARHDSGYTVFGQHGMGIVLSGGYHRYLTMDSNYKVLVLEEIPSMSGTRTAALSESSTRAADAAATATNYGAFASGSAGPGGSTSTVPPQIVTKDLTSGVRPSRRARQRLNQPPLPPPVSDDPPTVDETTTDDYTNNGSRTRLAGKVDMESRTRLAGKIANSTNDANRPTSPAGDGGAQTRLGNGDMTFDSATSTMAATQPTYNFVQACCESDSILETTAGKKVKVINVTEKDDFTLTSTFETVIAISMALETYYCSVLPALVGALGSESISPRTPTCWEECAGIGRSSAASGNHSKLPQLMLWREARRYTWSGLAVALTGKFLESPTFLLCTHSTSRISMGACMAW
jgi:hypothetical protein